jgi:methionine synthase II (cobalamin-independent)
MADDYKYHIDHHGSLVRPGELLAARASGDAAELAAAETEAAVAVSHALRRLALSAVGDGQFRREHFDSVVYDHVDGFGPADGAQPLADAAGIPAARRRSAPDDPRVTGRLARDETARYSPPRPREWPTSCWGTRCTRLCSRWPDVTS